MEVNEIVDERNYIDENVFEVPEVDVQNKQDHFH
jgi:hypothetical protein